MTDEELKEEIISIFSLPPDTIINSGYGMPFPITLRDIYKAGRRKTLAELKEAFEASREVNPDNIEKDQHYLWNYLEDVSVLTKYKTFDDWYKTRGKKL